MEPLQVRRHRDEEGQEWVTMRREDFLQLMERVEELEDIETFVAARESGEELLPFDQAMAESEAARR